MQCGCDISILGQISVIRGTLCAWYVNSATSGRHVPARFILNISHTDLHPPCIRTVPAIPTFHLFLHLFARLPHLCWQWVNIFSFNCHYLESLRGQGLCMNRPLLEEMTQKVLLKKHRKAGARVISLEMIRLFQNICFWSLHTTTPTSSSIALPTHPSSY